ncbi:MAG TPA: hypothetical protein VGH87_09360 [Polyangiaceae bacterium]
MKRTIRLSACALAIACGGASSSPTNTPAGGMSDDDQIFAAVVFHELEQASLASGEGVCVGARGATNDGTALLAAIRSRYPTAVPDGECSGGGPDGSHVVVTATHAKAVRIDIGPIEWAQEQGKATIASGGAYRAGGVREVEYTLEKHGSKWQITATKPKITT